MKKPPIEISIIHDRLNRLEDVVFKKKKVIHRKKNKIMI